jgi:hypothetical protein
MLEPLHAPRVPVDLAERRIGDIEGRQLFPVGAEYTPPARGTWTIAHTPMLVPGAHEIYVCPGNCLRGVVLSAAEGGFSDRFSMVEVGEEALYDGSMEDLVLEGVTDCLNRLGRRPTCVFVASSCIHDLMVLDVPHLLDELAGRFPDIDFVPAYMNCTMRRSKLGYEDVQWRQNYAALRPAVRDRRSVNTIGSPFALDPGCEIASMLASGGCRLRDLCRAETYQDYLDMATSWLNVYHWPVAAEAVRDLGERLGQEAVYLPYSWDGEEIRASLQALAGKAGLGMPDLDALEARAGEDLGRARRVLGSAEIRMDAAATPRPFGLARLLLEHGFEVTEVYADAVLPGDEAAFDWVRRHHPDLLVSAMVDFRMRLRGRDAAGRAEEAGRELVAIGQKAAYFTGTGRFVNMISNDGLFGFTGISRLAGMLEEAFRDERDARSIIQVKARGIEDYRLRPRDGVGEGRR